MADHGSGPRAFGVEKLGSLGAGKRHKSSDLQVGRKSGDLASTGSENCRVERAIELRFVASFLLEATSVLFS